MEQNQVHVYVSTDMEIEQLFNKDNVINFYFNSSEYYTLIIMEKDVNITNYVMCTLKVLADTFITM